MRVARRHDGSSWFQLDPSAEGLGSGVYELIEDHRGDTRRAAYTVRIADSIHVLHAFQKKSKSGIKTPRTDMALIERRLSGLLERYRQGGGS